MLLALFEAAPAELSVWRNMTDSRTRWRHYNPSMVKKKLTKLAAYHRYEQYDLYTGLVGHPAPSLFFGSRSACRRTNLAARCLETGSPRCRTEHRDRALPTSYLTGISRSAKGVAHKFMLAGMAAGDVDGPFRRNHDKRGQGYRRTGTLVVVPAY